jgi:cysteinylglycine-S-conjugate dipeptidase
MRDLRAAVAAAMPGVQQDLERLVRIESVSADPSRHDEVRRSAEVTAALFRDEGFEVDVLTARGGLPAVVARRPAPPGAPTVLLYAHHDVQPEGDHADWRSSPFQPTQRDGRLFGRGAADDKAGIAAHLAAVRSHGDNLPVGVTVFVEGEEEIGSPTLDLLLAEHQDRLRCDVIVIADSTNWAVGVPALTTSLRGLVDCVVEVRTLDHAVHSGMWGGVVPDALTTLCRLIATLHDAEGNVAVEGLATSSASDLDYPLERLREESGVLDGVALVGSGSVVERLWARPSIAVVGLDATRVAEASNTLIPAARAKISARLAPGDDSHHAMARLTDHLRNRVSWGAEVTVTAGDTAEPFTVDAAGPVYDATREAFAEAWDGVQPVDIGVGGSIPFLAAFADIFPDAVIVLTGVEDPDTRAHGADEGLHLDDFSRVCLAEALLLAKLASQSGPTDQAHGRSL